MASYSHDLLQDSHKKITLTLLHKFSQKPFYLKLFSWTLISVQKKNNSSLNNF